MKLAVFGDSWTWGDELVDPKYPERDCCDEGNDQYRLSHCFSGLIAEHYGWEYENYGHPGASLQSTVWTFLWWLQQDIKHEDYKHAFFNNKQICHKMKLSEATITNLEAMS